MGCGKTVEILALVLSKPPLASTPGVLNFAGTTPSRATLVICPVSLVGQWLEEAKSKLDGSLRLYMYHGTGRIRDAQRLASDYDLVVTTYQTLGADWRAEKGNKMLQSPLNAIRWHRVVLDESHTIKAGGTGQTLACCALKSARRWCCSGTPISTEIKDFISQFAFLEVKLLSEKAYFANFVHPSWQVQQTRSSYTANVCTGTNVLLYTLGRMLMRHTKAQVLGGQAVSQLPPKTEETIAVSFSQQEAQVYLKVHADAKAAFEKFLRYGSQYINRHLLGIMSLLGPLRRCCSGGALRNSICLFADNRGAGAQAAAGEAAPDEGLIASDEECSVCLNAFERPTITPCSHWFCRECILAEAEEHHICPRCRTDIAAEGLREGVMPGDDEVIGQAGHAQKQQFTLFESKLNVLLKELAAMRERDPAAKALIFTQFSSTLTWLGHRLQQEGYGYRTISGGMALKKRAKAIEAFQKDPPTTVFLLSMRSGAVGINLTAANHVFLMEPAFNPALEDQAVGRAHRMGQTRPVTVKKFYIKGSVEERIMEIIKQRKAGQQPGSRQEAEKEPQKFKRKQQDVAGSLKADRQNLRTAELEQLFKDPSFQGLPKGGAGAAPAGV
ncbi:g5380 [Coccomyxa viridis]|uniref:G5380 protein n=1 Tax=Coccomyxa viridis TaxID=1274662 RepID=A0ABP1FXL9_9CHLO